MPSQTFTPAEAWTAASPEYSARVGTMSTLAATRLLTMATSLLPISPSRSNILDHGAGTGALSKAATARFPHAPILATDISPGMLAVLRSAQLPNIRTRVLDACEPCALGVVEPSDNDVDGNVCEGLPSTGFSHAFSTFMLQFAVRPEIALADMYRVLQPGGVIGLGIWGENNDPIAIWQQACRSVDRDYVTPHAYEPKAWKNKQEVEAAMRAVGFRDVKSEVARVPLVFEGVEEYLAFWFGAKNPVAQGLIAHWMGVNADGEPKRGVNEVKSAVEKVLVEGRYECGRKVFVEVVLTVGSK